MEQIETQCCIAGGGPAGLMLGYLLARVGVRVVVLEKHADFLRDFRGDTIHPSTMQVMQRLGELDDFLTLPHHKFRDMTFDFAGTAIPMVDFKPIGPETGFVAMMPQWDFLDFIAGRAAAYDGFELRMQTRATGTIREGGRVVGVTAETTDGPIEIRADLVVGADGRDSDLRVGSGLNLREFGSPMDVQWFRLTRLPHETDQSLGKMRDGQIFIMLNRGDYWQIASVVPKKGGDAAVRELGLPAFRANVGPVLGVSAERMEEIDSWDEVKLLNVQVARLDQWWQSGLLFIGDAAHAMSPVGGIGINLAIQDAVAAANILAGPLREGRLTDADLAAVQARRLWPVKVSQWIQVTLQKRIIQPTMKAGKSASVPLPMRILRAVPWLRRFPARFIGLGLRPEYPSERIVNGRG